jgi:hypothetical protein
MVLYKGHLFRPVLWLALLAIAMFASGCRTITGTSLFTTTGTGWHVQQGQALWRPGRGMPELGGDLVMASDEDGRCAIEFAKTPMSLVSAQTTRTNWLIQFPAGQMVFTGHRQPPTRFGWLYLHAALGGEPLPQPLRFERKPDGGWRLENTRTGETLEGFLSP